jgi:hyperosmotically inducible protein
MGSSGGLSDDELRKEIATRLDANNIKTVQVSVVQGVATLTGAAPDQATSDRAAEVARGVEGVASVTNQITVGGVGPVAGPTPPVGPTPSVNTPDQVTAAKINQRLIAEPSLAGSKVDVQVVGGVATLTGTVASDAAKAAAEKTAKSVDGITSVTNNLQVVAAAPEPTVPDEQLKDQVDAAIEQQFNELTLFVQVNNGTVSLSGAVPNRGYILQVSNAIHAIKGVKSVDTGRLTVQGGEAGNERIGAPSKKP